MFNKILIGLLEGLNWLFLAFSTAFVYLAAISKKYANKLGKQK